MAMVAGISKRVNARTFRKPLNRRQVKQVQKIVEKNKELKMSWTAINDASADSGNPTFVELTTIAEGEDFNQRDSDKVNLISLDLKFSIGRLPATTNNTVSFLRMLVVRAKGRPLTVTDMTNDILVVGTTPPDIDLYQILDERILGLGPFDSDSNGMISNVVINYSKKYKFKNAKVPHMTLLYDDDESATACQKNAIYLFIISSDTTTFQVAGQAKLKFYTKD